MIKKVVLLFVFILFVSVNLSLAQENPAQNKLLARRAAIADAQRTLVQIIYGIQLDSKTSVKDFMTKEDSVKTQMEGFIRNAEIVNESYLNEIYKVTMRIDVNKLKTIIGKEFEYDAPFVEAIGKGAPRSENQPREASQPKPDQQKQWYERTLRVKGYGARPSDPEMSSSQKQLMAERAAKMDAYRNLIELIKGTNVNSGTTVKDLVTADDMILTNINAFVRGARVVDSKSQKDGSFEITLEINLEPMKSIVE